MNRRTFLYGLTLNALATALTEAQPAGKAPMIGYLSGSSASAARPGRKAFGDALRDLGWIEGKNVFIEARWAEGDSSRLPGLAAELVNLNVDVILAAGAMPVIRAAKEATSTIPIVTTIGVDLVGQGFIASVRRPGGNISGMAWDPDPIIMEKYLEFLKEMVPGLRRVGGIRDRAEPVTVYWNAADRAAPKLGLTLHIAEVGTANEIETAFATVVRRAAQAVLVQGSALFFINRSQLVAAAAKHRLPDIYIDRAWVEAGGLMSYGVRLTDLYAGAAGYVDKILKGAKPGDLPVEQAAKFELVINLKTAKALGLTIPQSVLIRADEVIQ